MPFASFFASIIALLWFLQVGPSHAAQQWNAQTAISSSEFLQLVPSAGMSIDNSQHLFPKAVTENTKAAVDKNGSPFSVEPAVATAQAASVQTANFESSATPWANTPIGTGVGPIAPTVPEGMPISAQQINPLQSAPPTTPQANRSWFSAMNLNPSGPNYLVGFEVIGFRRNNDTVGPYSNGGNMSRFDQEVSGRYTVSKLLGSIERLEFKFTGPLHWDRQLDTNGPVDSRLPSSLATPFNNADHHRQSQGVRLSSYELNRCVTGDEFSKFFYGLRCIDLDERYQLQAMQGATSNLFGIKAHNLMVGPQFGIDINRPFSQRMNAGLGIASGLYGNFAKGAVTSSSGSSSTVDLRDDRLRLSMMLETAARINYQITPRIVATGGYEFWYFPALATTANQRLDYISSVPNFSLRTGDDQLFRGWTIGLSGRF